MHCRSWKVDVNFVFPQESFFAPDDVRVLAHVEQTDLGLDGVDLLGKVAATVGIGNI